MISDRLTIFPDLPARPRRQASFQLQFPWNDGFGKITFADEIRHHVNFANLRLAEKKERVTQAWLLFPKAAGDLAKHSALPDCFRLRQARRARIGIHRRSMTNDEKGRFGLLPIHGEKRKPVLRA